MKKLGARHENLDFKVYGKLKSMIVDRRLEPGDKILQEKLARELGVSRTPLMCALKKLEQEKLVRAIPRRGFYVRLFTRDEILEAFELREVLEDSRPGARPSPSARPRRKRSAGSSATPTSRTAQRASGAMPTKTAAFTGTSSSWGGSAFSATSSKITTSSP
ncbi:MAG: GntR family transcriptional regulator [Syntrophaceae bacterium]|nr:GntR family transcriptional regulator [Syntrophaceae bacterium]